MSMISFIKINSLNINVAKHFFSRKLISFMDCLKLMLNRDLTAEEEFLQIMKKIATIRKNKKEA